MKKLYLAGIFFGLFLTSVCFLSCSQDDESFAPVDNTKACAPASEQASALVTTNGVDSLIAQIVSDPDNPAKVVSITYDNLTGELDMTFDPNYITTEQSQSLKSPANGWKLGGHVSNEWDAYKLYRRLSGSLSGAKRIYFMVIKDAKGGWDVYYKTTNK